MGPAVVDTESYTVSRTVRIEAGARRACGRR